MNFCGIFYKNTYMCSGLMEKIVLTEPNAGGEAL